MLLQFFILFSIHFKQLYSIKSINTNLFFLQDQNMSIHPSSNLNLLEVFFITMQQHNEGATEKLNALYFCKHKAYEHFEADIWT